MTDPASQHFQELAYPQGTSCTQSLTELVADQHKNDDKQSPDNNDEILQKMHEDASLWSMYRELSKKVSFTDYTL